MAIARALDTKGSTLQRWFGGSFPSAEYLFKIYEIFGVTPNFLLGIQEKAKSRLESLPVPTLELVDFVNIKEPIKKRITSQFLLPPGESLLGEDHFVLPPENPEYKVQSSRTNPDPIIGRVIWCSKKL